MMMKKVMLMNGNDDDRDETADKGEMLRIILR